MSAEREISENRIRVVCRVRPLNDREKKAGSKVIVSSSSKNENSLSIGVSNVNTYL